MIICLLWLRPIQSKRALFFEIFNEHTTLLILYLLMCFSDFMSDPELRRELGFVFIGTICVFAAVHLGFIIYDMVKTATGCIKKCAKKKQEKAKKQAMALE
mmetsp:Transcript_23798/g.31859  ORF Transcript_23798/g.31859 Transcript_23798/m.31859 type:complete len:101 (+) Transcript_23798:1200-1502(+)